MNPHENIRFDFCGHTVLVTGSSGWLGAGIAQKFADAGAAIVLHGRVRRENIDALEISIRENGGAVYFVQADLCQAAQVDAMFDKIQSEFGLVDILINNAGIFPTSNILDMAEEEWDDVVNANLKSVFLCTQRFAKDLISAKKKGAIVNIDSIESLDSTRMHSHYDAAKAGVVMFTKVAALELGKNGIRVNTVGPGLINSPNLATWQEGKRRWLDRVPLGRLCEREDIASACMFLSSDAANFISGAHLIVDGGMLTNETY